MCSSESRQCMGSAAAGLFEARSAAHLNLSTQASRVLEEGLAHARAPSRSRSRSRSAGNARSDGEVSPSPRREAQEETQEEKEATALKTVHASFTEETRQHLLKLVSVGLLRSMHDFDYKAYVNLQALPQPLQTQVCEYLETERIFLVNSRSRSGFLMSACEKARQGILDARGFSLKDPWHEHLMSIARPKTTQVDLVPEEEWLAQHGDEPARLVIDVSADKDLGLTSVTLGVSLSHTPETIKKRLAVIGVKMPLHKMRLKAAEAGFLKDTKTLAFYNLQSGSEVRLICKTRAGVATKKDQSDGFDPAYCTGVTSSYLAI